MVKPRKLYQQLLESSQRSISFRDFERLLEAFGFENVRISGSHRIYTHLQIPRPFPVQPSGKDAKRYQVRELLELVEQFGLHLSE